jgi:sec-independent protein translocase protein TatA
MPFGIHLPELLAVCVVAILVFGPKRLPEMGSAIGKTFREFKKSVNEITDAQARPVAQTEQLPAAVETTVVVPMGDGVEAGK